VELANQIRLQPPKPLPRKTPRGERIPAWLGDVIAKCLEKKPADRYKSMAALGEALAAGGRVRSSGLPWWLLKPAAATATGRRPATVELSLRSSPSGARVVRLDTGARLGRTPLSVTIPRKAATVWIQMTLDGYKPIKFTVDLRKDNSANVTFQGVKRTTRRR
jgi:serine/threonine-protein kinase